MIVTIGVLVALTIAGMSFFLQLRTINAHFLNWTEYKTSQGFIFSYPPGHAVTESSDPENPDARNYFIVALVDDDTMRQSPPVLQINASPSMVSVALWEGIPWEGYPKILETLRWK